MKKIIVFLFLLSFLCAPPLVKAKEIITPTPDYPTVQKALDAASYGDKIIVLKGEYLFNTPISIKENGLSIFAKGKVIFTNKKGSAITAEGCNLFIQGITFFRNEIAIEGNNSIILVKKCSFKKNRIGAKIENSTLNLENNLFQTNYLAGALLINKHNFIKITSSNKFKDNYVDVFSAEISSENFNSNFEGNKISLGNSKD